MKASAYLQRSKKKHVMNFFFEGMDRLRIFNLKLFTHQTDVRADRWVQVYGVGYGQINGLTNRQSERQSRKYVRTCRQIEGKVYVQTERRTGR